MIEDLGSFSPAHQDRIFCSSCGTWQEGCNGDECDVCQRFTCYECGTILHSEPNKRQWLCEGCAEQAQLDFKGEPEDDSEPDYLELITGHTKAERLAVIHEAEIKREAAERDLEEARGK